MSVYDPAVELRPVRWISSAFAKVSMELAGVVPVREQRCALEVVAVVAAYDRSLAPQTGFAITDRTTAPSLTSTGGLDHADVPVSRTRVRGSSP